MGSPLFTESQKPASSFGVHTLRPIHDVVNPDPAEWEGHSGRYCPQKLCPDDGRERWARPFCTSSTWEHWKPLTSRGGNLFLEALNIHT